MVSFAATSFSSFHPLIVRFSSSFDDNNSLKASCNSVVALFSASVTMQLRWCEGGDGKDDDMAEGLYTECGIISRQAERIMLSFYYGLFSVLASTM
jgi:hypothetical protein